MTAERNRPGAGNDPTGHDESRVLVKPAARPSLAARLRNYFLTGIVVTAPIGITIYIAWAFIDFVDATVTPLIPPQYQPETLFKVSIPGLGIVIVMIGLTAIVGQFCFLRAYKLAQASFLAPISYFQMVIGAAMGFIIFQEVPTWWTIGGAVVIAFCVIVGGRDRHAGSSASRPAS